MATYLEKSCIYSEIYLNIESIMYKSIMYSIRIAQGKIACIFTRESEVKQLPEQNGRPWQVM